MEVFISWSGDRSYAVAAALREWLPLLLPYVKPYVSADDIRKGNRWGVDIASKLDEAIAAHKERMRSGVEEQWKQLLALEQVVSEVRVKFDGEDPALPVLREVLDGSREKLEELHGETQKYVGPFELPEPGDGEVAWVRELAERQQV